VLTADAAHVVAAAVWTGGVALLILALRRRRAEEPGAGGAAAVVARFSTVATTAILAVIIAGSVLAFVEVRALRALDTTYGWLLVAKVAVVSLVAVAGAYNHFRLVPSIERTGDERGDTLAWARLHRTLRLEVLGMVVILGVTAVLVATQPAREAAGVGGGTASATATLGPGTVNVVVDPARPGTSQLHVYILDATGRPVTDIQSASVEMRLPAKDLGPLTPRVVKAGPGHYQLLDATFPFAGSWQLSVDVRVDEFTAWRATVPIEIRK
jgi:copper transport protein